MAGVRSRGSARNGSNDSPIQYDELRIEHDQGDVEIVVYNRAILLFATVQRGGEAGASGVVPP